jgi:hypothetical protein
LRLMSPIVAAVAAQDEKAISWGIGVFS